MSDPTTTKPVRKDVGAAWVKEYVDPMTNRPEKFFSVSLDTTKIPTAEKVSLVFFKNRRKSNPETGEINPKAPDLIGYLSEPRQNKDTEQQARPTPKTQQNVRRQVVKSNPTQEGVSNPTPNGHQEEDNGVLV